MSELLKVSEVAEELNYGVSTVYGLIGDGTLPVIQRKKGGAIRIKRDDVEQYKEANYSGEK